MVDRIQELKRDGVLNCAGLLEGFGMEFVIDEIEKNFLGAAERVKWDGKNQQG